MARKKTEQPQPYGRETVQYSVAATGKQPAADVDLVLTYNATQTKKEARLGYYEVVGASGTYTELNSDGSAAATYPVKALLPAQTYHGNTQRIYIDNSAVPTVIDKHGISYEISLANQYDSGRNERVNLSYFGNTFSQTTRLGKSEVTSLTTSAPVTTPEPVSSQSLATSQVVCFAQGTRILTTRGEIEVEALAVGDLVVTASGARRPIRWLGHRTIDTRRHPRRDEVLPVRIVAHAFGTDCPARDLRVSPGHAICLDILGEVLVPAGALVDGVTIVQEQVEHVTYWHVELESHDILLAENCLAESYLDMSNRGFFVESNLVSLSSAPDATVVTHADFCRPYVDGGPLLEAVRRRQAETGIFAAPRRARAA